MKVAIIGGGAAGMSAASRVKALRPNWDVKVFEKSRWVSHAPCGIPFFVGGAVEKFDELCAYDIDYFKRERGIDVHTNARVVEIEEGRLTVDEGGKEASYEWDKLLFATGSKAVRLNVEGENLEGVIYVDDIENAERVKIEAMKVDNVVVVGSGYIGVEMADAITRLGKNVTVIEVMERPLPEYDAEIAAIIKSEMEKYVNLRLSEKVTAFEGKDRVEKVVTNKGEYPCELAIIAVGVAPNTDLAKGFVELGVKGAIRTNSRMETSRENVYAAGDCAESINIVTGREDWIPLAAPANKMGYVAGVNMAGLEMHYPGSLKSQLTGFKDIEIGKAGLSENEAIRFGYEVVSAYITSRTSARYLPSGLIHLKVVADRNGKLLGLQAVGKDVAMRVYAASALLHKNGDVKDLFFCDFPYYPPVSRVWDPLVVAARNIFRKLGLP
ncbi:MAG: NADH oxidase (NoxA-1) [Archaeoglobus fulgidus]|uniref:NADH oxidase (NoxA-1) n=1 Tax=Archaeoglobus fulgidus TaxID=2234 RepID=A0A101DFG3_ARCFL|nr:FAD-dependent oxidoreductase [Archaeoglobus fulgidus]KUJ94508.1 MAG: NADH oxidase (NoxA-1) [Archaeoglobus fulgidus]